MSTAYTAVSIFLVPGVPAAATAHLTDYKRAIETLANLDISLRAILLLAICLIAGGIGLVGGFWLAPVGIAAAVGLVL